MHFAFFLRGAALTRSACLPRSRRRQRHWPNYVPLAEDLNFNYRAMAIALYTCGKKEL